LRATGEALRPPAKAWEKPMGSRSLAAAAMAGAALLLGPGGAQAACSLKSFEVPVTMEGLRPLVAGKINGQPVRLLLDSGAFFSSLDAKFAAQQKLRAVARPTLGTRLGPAAETVTLGAGGTGALTGIVVAPAFEFAGAKFANVPFLTHELGDGPGILGQNFLHQLDNEYDLKSGVMRLVRPEGEGCKTTEMVYWATPGMTYSVIPLESSEGINAHTLGVVTINGVKMKATFDTGAATTFITARAAARAGVRTTDPGVKPAGYSSGIDRDDIKTWVGRFASVKIGDEEIKNTALAIGDSYATDFDVLIGADFFLAHHVYVANSQRKLYFTYNGGPVFHVPKAEEAAASDEPRTAK
jgi:predicted aspartyl protease